MGPIERVGRPEVPVEFEEGHHPEGTGLPRRRLRVSRNEDSPRVLGCCSRSPGAEAAGGPGVPPRSLPPGVDEERPGLRDLPTDARSLPLRPEPLSRLAPETGGVDAVEIREPEGVRNPAAASEGMTINSTT